MKKKTKNIILISLLAFLCAILVAGIAVVVSVFVGEGCDMPTNDSSSSSSSSSSSVPDVEGEGDGEWSPWV